MIVGDWCTAVSIPLHSRVHQYTDRAPVDISTLFAHAGAGSGVYYMDRWGRLACHRIVCGDRGALGVDMCTRTFRHTSGITSAQISLG